MQASLFFRHSSVSVKKCGKSIVSSISSIVSCGNSIVSFGNSIVSIVPIVSRSLLVSSRAFSVGKLVRAVAVVAVAVAVVVICVGVGVGVAVGVVVDFRVGFSLPVFVDVELSCFAVFSDSSVVVVVELTNAVAVIFRIVSAILDFRAFISIVILRMADSNLDDSAVDGSVGGGSVTVDARGAGAVSKTNSKIRINLICE